MFTKVLLLAFALTNSLVNGQDICPPGETLWPHEDCTKYWVCGGSEPVLLDCPTNLYFTWGGAYICDVPANVPDCVGGTRPPPTGPTGAPPTTEAVTTTEHPTTPLFTDGPTTPPPTGTQPTTNQPPTTPAPTPGPQSCGITFFNPWQPISIGPLAPDMPANSEIWRARLYNVVSTAVIEHPYAHYINAYRLDQEYWLEVTEDYQNFKEEQGSNVITRSVILFCEDQTTVTYSFLINIE